jgi:hypothetical protein
VRLWKTSRLYFGLRKFTNGPLQFLRDCGASQFSRLGLDWPFPRHSDRIRLAFGLVPAAESQRKWVGKGMGIHQQDLWSGVHFRVRWVLVRLLDILGGTPAGKA